MRALLNSYPWVKAPLLVSAPMLGAATPLLAANVSKAGGFGFVAGGTNPEALDKTFNEIRTLFKASDPRGLDDALPIGVGFQLFNSPLNPIAKIIEKHTPSALWLFAPKETSDFQTWSEQIRKVTGGKTRIWIQVGSVAEARQALDLASPDVLVVQGSDAGGHGQRKSASIISLLPEVLDMAESAGHGRVPILAAGGIVDGRGVAAALALGASGVVMGTRFLVAQESGIAAGWKREIVRCDDGGVSTTRSTLCDRLKETKGWPSQYDGRAILNKGHEDEEAGMPESENVELYKKELQQGDSSWGPHGRMVAYAGTGLGLIEKVEPAAQIVGTILTGTEAAMKRASQSLEMPNATFKL